MIIAAVALAASAVVSPFDRLAMADRLFNRGDVASARAEYLALKGEKEIDAAELAYRLVASANALSDGRTVRSEGAAFLRDFPSDKRADRVRLFMALCAEGQAKAAELAVLDRDDAEPAIRAEALYRLAEAAGDAECYAKCFKADPEGRFADYARIAYASHLLENRDSSESRRGVAMLMDLVYGKNKSIARDALYIAAVHSYKTARYGESSALLKRYMRQYPGDERAMEVRRLAALSELMDGKNASAFALSEDDSDETLAYVRAVASRRLGRNGEARRLSEKYLRDFPDGRSRPAIELQLARIAFDDSVKSNGSESAVLAARRCLELSKSPSDRMLVAWALENAGEPERAEEEYSAVAKEAPSGALAADAMYRRAMSLARRGKWPSAELSLAEALAGGRLAEDRAASAYYWRGVAAFKCGHSAEAGEFLAKAVEKGLPLDEKREARLLMADIDLSAGRRDKAVAAYADLVAQGAVERMSAAKTLAVGRLLSGEGAKTCAKALTGNESAEWRQAGYALLGDAEEAEGNFTAAADAWTRCLAEPCVTEPAASVSVKLGAHLVRDGNPSGAEAVLKRAVELNKHDNAARSQAYLHLAKAALLRDDVECARRYATVLVTLFEGTKAAEEAEKILKR